MILAVKAWRLREAARAAMEAGRFERAFELTTRAQEAQRTVAGDALWVVSGLLSGGGWPAAGDC
jgi:hypothetical protein